MAESTQNINDVRAACGRSRCHDGALHDLHLTITKHERTRTWWNYFFVTLLLRAEVGERVDRYEVDGKIAGVLFIRRTFRTAYRARQFITDVEMFALDHDELDVVQRFGKASDADDRS